jgi:hypothetical protein
VWFLRALSAPEGGPVMTPLSHPCPPWHLPMLAARVWWSEALDPAQRPPVGEPGRMAPDALDSRVRDMHLRGTDARKSPDTPPDAQNRG